MITCSEWGTAPLAKLLAALYLGKPFGKPEYDGNRLLNDKILVSINRFLPKEFGRYQVPPSDL